MYLFNSREERELIRSRGPRNSGAGFGPGGVANAGRPSILLLEDGTEILLEDGTHLLMEDTQ